MKKNLRSLILRKLVTTFTTSTTVPFLLAFFQLNEAEFKYNLGNQLMGWTFFYSMYVGVIVLVYGNAVSIILELCQIRWFSSNQLIYVLLHGLFGLANGLLFQSWIFAMFGLLTALFYAIIDRWVFARILNKKKIKLFFIIPVVIYGLSWGTFQVISPTQPPFTKEDAVAFATSGEGTIIDRFPEKIGEVEEVIGGFKVVKETSVKEIEHEVYIVTFSEKWSNGYEEGKWTISYKVTRGQLGAYGESGEEPPYWQ